MSSLITRIDSMPKQVEHEFPLEIAIKAHLALIAETDEVPVYDTIQLLHRCLSFLESNTQSLSGLTKTVENTIKDIRSNLQQGHQA